MSEDIIMEDGIGVVFEIEVIDSTTDAAYDLTGATTLSIIFKKPGGTVVTQTASAPTPTNGKMQYSSQSGDLDETGWWKMQGRIQGPGSIDYYTELHQFKVHERLE